MGKVSELSRKIQLKMKLYKYGPSAECGSKKKAMLHPGGPEI